MHVEDRLLSYSLSLENYCEVSTDKTQLEGEPYDPNTLSEYGY